MSKRVCVIGNSHLGAVKHGWDLVAARHAALSLDFFGSPSQTLSHIHVAGSLLKSDNPKVRSSLQRSGGADHIDLSRYDAIWLVGGTVGTRVLANMLRGRQVYSVSEGGTGRMLVSREFVTEAYCERLERTPARTLIDKIGRASGIRVQFVHEPHMSLNALNQPELPVREVHRNGMAEMVAEVFERCFEETFGAIATLVRQPPETVVKSMCTKPDFSMAAVGLANMAEVSPETKAGDCVHMNAAYGRLVIEAMIERSGLSKAAA